MTNRYVELLVSVMVLALIVGTVGITLTTSAISSTEVVKTNEYGIFASAGNDETITISCSINADDSTKYDWTVNGETIQFKVIDTNLRPLFLADTINVYLDNDGDIIVSHYTNARYTGQTGVEFTIEDGKLNGSTYLNGEVSHSYTNLPIEWAFYASESGDYRSFYLLSGQNFPIYYKDINDIYGSNFIFTTDKFYSFHGTDVSYYAVSTTPTHITANVDSDNVRGTVDMQKMDVSRTTGDYTFIIDNNGADYTAHPYQFIVPYKVVSDSIEYSPTIAVLIGLIPLIAMLGVVFVSVYFVARRYV